VRTVTGALRGEVLPLASNASTANWYEVFGVSPSAVAVRSGTVANLVPSR
jgi:hypothetical protein